MENNEEIPELHKKLVNGVEISNLDLAKIAMICDYLVVDRFHDISSFVRFERCFGPFFAKEPTEFLSEVFQEICGEKKKIYFIWSFNSCLYKMDIKIINK